MKRPLPKNDYEEHLRSLRAGQEAAQKASEAFLDRGTQKPATLQRETPSTLKSERKAQVTDVRVLDADLTAAPANYATELAEIFDHQLRERRPTPEQDRAWDALKALFTKADGTLDIPLQREMQNGELLEQVNLWCDREGKPRLKMDSLLRVTGRPHWRAKRAKSAH